MPTVLERFDVSMGDGARAQVQKSAVVVENIEQALSRNLDRDGPLDDEREGFPHSRQSA